MKKRIALMATALLCAIAICLSVIPALTIFAEGDEATNVALGKTVAVNNGNSIEAYSADGWGAEALTDGREGYGGWLGDFNAVYTTPEAPTILTVDLDGTYELTSVVVKPYDGTAFVAPIMPLEYAVEVYDVEAEEWVEVGYEELCLAVNSSSPNYTGEKTPAMEYVLDEAIVANQVRVVAIQDSYCDIGVPAKLTGIGEIEAYGTPAEAEAPAPELTNVAYNAYVEVNDLNNIEDGSNWGAAFLVDGDTVRAWHGDYINTDGTDPANPTQLTIYLGDECEVSSISVYPFTGTTYESVHWDPPIKVPVLPQAFTLEVFSVEENDWVKVADYRIAGAWNIEVADPEVLTYDFDPVVATQVRMTINENGGYWDPAFFRSGVTVIGDISVMGYALGGSTETETQAPAVTETQAPVVTETQAPAETEAPEVTETEAVVESDVESDVESAEDTAEETTVEETAADTVVDETVADTTAATEAPAADADEGCASVVGFGAVAVLAAAAAAFVLKKKD